MKVKRIAVDSDKLEGTLLSLLRGHVFHVTKAKNYASILSAGAIEPNQDDRFEYSFCQSEISYGRKRGYVCFFDLRSIEEKELERALCKLYFLNPYHNYHAIFFLLKEEAYKDLISWTAAKKEVRFEEMYIPYVECWYPGRVPLALISHVYDVTIEPSTIFDRALYSARNEEDSGGNND